MSEIESIKNLDIHDKQSLVELLMDIQCGNISCRRGASEILKQINDCHCSRWEVKYNVLKQMNEVHKEARQKQAKRIAELEEYINELTKENIHLRDRIV